MAVVTGGSRGIGREIALGLARASANVVVIARDRTDGERTCGELARAGSPDPMFLEADLSERSQVRALAGHLAERLDRIDVLVNNAAVVSPRRRETEDGIELTLAVGHLAAFHLTERVHPLLLRGAPARVVNVTSGIVHRADLALDDLQSVASYDPLEAYGRSKLMTLAWTLDLARRWAPDGIDVHAADPGVADTGTHRDFPWPLLARIGLVLARRLARARFSAERAARSTLAAATAPDLRGRTGLLLDRHGRETAPPARAADPRVADDVRRLSMQLTLDAPTSP